MTAAIVALWLVLVVPFAAALAALPPNGDTAWLLYVARAMNAGQTLGRDVLEINLPLILWLKQPVVLAADRLGLPSGTAFVSVVALAILAVVVCTERLLRHADPPWNDRQRLLACAWLLFVATFECGIAFGQREHLAAVAVMPYLVAVGLRWDGAVLPRVLALVVGAAAGIGFGLKPFFVPTFAAAELALAYRRRSARIVLRAEAVACALVLATYAAAIPLAVPEWLASARVYWPVYDRF
ncbi:MAG TPA: hypothetical protein VFX50_14665, partial [Gemmatimonadales bacterium]|nr:hypothetical protein [Gemmatimonadales bacterium]